MGKGPGSHEGLQEQAHWLFENRLTNAEKEWLLNEASNHLEGEKLREVRKWINSSRRDKKALIGLATRWGVTIPKNLNR